MGIIRVRRDDGPQKFVIKSGDVLRCGVHHCGERRYLWVVENHSTFNGEYGFTHSLSQAMEEINSAKQRLSTRSYPQVYQATKYATNLLRKLNREKRRRRPPKTGTSQTGVTEYIYRIRLDQQGTKVLQIYGKYRITRFTRRSIFYDKQNLLRSNNIQHDDDMRFGRVYKDDLDCLPQEYWTFHHSTWTLKDPDTWGVTVEKVKKADLEKAVKELRNLRMAAAKAHPDAGGTAEAFIAADRLFKAQKKRVDKMRAAMAA